MTANPHRGEVEIELEGQTHLMRATFESMTQIEQGTGRPIMELVRCFGERSFGFADVTAVVAAGLRGAGAPVTDKRAAEMVFESGVLKAAGAATVFLYSLLNAGVTATDLAGDDEPGILEESDQGEAPAAEG